jgi:hypothetical protein
MNKEEARLVVLSEYDRWAKKHPNEASVMGGFLFFRYLQNERSDLLDFRAGDKWQIVHGWIRGRLEVLISLRSAGRQQASESGKGK